MKFKKRWALIAPIGLACLLYVNSLFGDFVYDDRRAILTNPDVYGGRGLSSLFTNDFWGTPIDSSNSHGSYRPLTVLSFRLNYSLPSIMGSRDTFWFHCTNVVLHTAVTWLYVRMLGSMIDNQRILVLSTALFACHPIHVEAVSSIVGRAELIAALFLLLSILFYVQYCRKSSAIPASSSSGQKHVYLGASCLFAGLAMLSKEHGIVALPICVAYHLFVLHRVWPLSRRTFTQLWKEREYSGLRLGVGILSLWSSILIFARMWIINFRSPDFSTADNPTAKSSSVITRILTFFYLPVFNFYLLIFPYTLSFDWSMDALTQIESIFDLKNVLTLFFYSSFVFTGLKILQLYRIQWCGAHNEENIPSTSINKKLQEFEPVSSKSVDSFEDLNNNNSSSLNFNLFNTSNVNNFNTSHFNNENNNENNNNNITQWSNNYNDDNNNDPSFPNLMAHCSKPFNPAPQIYPRGCKPPPKKPPTLPIKISRSSQFTKSLNKLDLVMLSLVLLVIPFLPATNLFFYVGFVVAERILYIPSFGYCLLIAIGCESLLKTFPKLKRFLYVSYVITVVAYSFKTFQRNFDWNSEEQLYRSAIEVNPAKAYGNLASVLDLKGDKQEAEYAYRQALVYRPNMADVHYNLGLLYQGQQKFDDAIECYEKAIQYRPKLAQAYLNLGGILSKLGQVNHAMELYRHCVHIDPTGMKNLRELQSAQIGALYSLGKLHTEAGEHEKALSVFLQAVDRSTFNGVESAMTSSVMKPQHHQHRQSPSPQSLFNIVGETLLKLNRTQNAELWFRRALSVSESGQTSAQLTWAKFLVRQNRTNEAEKVYQDALKVSPNDSAIYEHYGHLLSRLLRFERALELYREAFRLAPQSYEIVIGLADTLRELKKNREAEKYYELAANLRRNEPIVYSNLGAIYHLNGKYELAHKNYLIALRLKPEDNITQINLAKLRQITG